MTIEISQGKPRPRVPRPGEGADVAATVLAGPYKDPETGRFVEGNQAARLRGLKRAPKLTTLNPAMCAEWARPFVELAQQDASELAVEVGAETSPSLLAFAEDAAIAGAMERASLAIALAPETDAKTKAAALNDARMWLRERRQSLLSLRGEARAPLPERPERPHDAPPPWLVAARPDDGATESASESDDASERRTAPAVHDTEPKEK